jgi:hypothetical protein
MVHQDDRHDAFESYLTIALGPLPAHPGARRTWQHAARRIETYRSERGIEDASSALGPEPASTAERARWRQAQRDIKRAQLALGQTVDLGHQL